MTKDLTAIYYTSNHLEVVNPRFVAKTKELLLESLGDIPLVSVSQVPMHGFGLNVCVGVKPRGHLEIYKSILVGARVATTDYIGLVEDDIIYAPSHFTTHRPPLHKFSYDFNKWGINTWVTPPVFGYRARAVVNQLIAPRQLLIDALEERFAMYPDIESLQRKFGPDNPLKFWGDLGRYEKHLGVTVREWEPFAAPDPSVVFSHEEAFGFLSRGKRKSIGEGHRPALPFWGRAVDVLRIWKEDE